MKFRNRFRDDDEPIPTASMADITFLLIIFFMVSTVFDVSRGIQMRLPATTTQQDIKERTVTISIDATQALFLDGEKVEYKDLATAYETETGQVVIATGEGFPSGAQIRLSWSEGITPSMPVVVADGDGRFRVSPRRR